MTRRSFAWITPVVVATAGLVGLACSSSKSTGPKLTPEALVGAWSLDTLATTNVTSTPPQARGTLQLTDSTYKVYVVVETGNAPGDTAVAVKDSGTYTISGSTFTENSLTGLPAVTATASLRGNGDTLDVDVTSPAQAAGTFVWSKLLE
jgi:hypothetical protein